MEDTKPKPFVFVLMPFSSEFTDIYEVGIKPACRDAGAYCERVDEQIFVENILERVYNQIAKADVIVAEMSGRNPNVFYETGYAHALNKRVILLTRNADDIPFDLKHYPHIIYEGKIAVLKSQLEARIKWCVENLQKPLTSVNIDLEFLINGIPLLSQPEVTIAYEGGVRFGMTGGRRGYSSGMKIGIHNKTNKLIDPKSYSLALILPKAIEIREGISSPLSNEQTIWNLLPQHSLFPDAWESITVGLLIDHEALSNSPFNSVLRLFTELGPKDFHFTLSPSKRSA